MLGAVNAMMEHYSEGKIDRLFLVYNRFKHCGKNQRLANVAVPKEDISRDKEARWDYLYDSLSRHFNHLIQRYEITGLSGVVRYRLGTSRADDGNVCRDG